MTATRDTYRAEVPEHLELCDLADPARLLQALIGELLIVTPPGGITSPDGVAGLDPVAEVADAATRPPRPRNLRVVCH